jgi:hypothetical protein
MGSPYAFECRREELQALYLPYDDNAIVDSFLRLILPRTSADSIDGLLLTYLQSAHMAVILEDTIFIHGGITASYLGWIPPALQSPGVYKGVLTGHSAVEADVGTWCHKLNAFARKEVRRRWGEKAWLR